MQWAPGLCGGPARLPAALPSSSAAIFTDELENKMELGFRMVTKNTETQK